MPRNSFRLYLPFILFALSLGTVFFFWWEASGNLFQDSWSQGAIALGRIAGLLVAYTILLQITVIGRVRWIESVFGFDRLTQFHRLTGLTLGCFIILHPLLLTLGYAAASGNTFFNQFLSFYSTWEYVNLAVLAFILLYVVVFFSITIVRKQLKYETWYFVHLLVYAVILLSFWHQITIGGDFLGKDSNAFRYYWYGLYVFAIGHLLIFRFGIPLFLFNRHRFVVESVVKETDDVASITISGKDMDTFLFRPGQFAIFRFFAKGYWWQAHPFSFSKVPNGRTIRITPKGVGDYTKTLPQLPVGTSVLIDGPYGVFTRERARTKKYLFIAGGIGITPIRALMEEAAKAGEDMILLYANKYEKGIALRGELEEICRGSSSPLCHVISDDPLWSGEKTYIDEEKIRRLVPDFLTRDVYVCGPPPMMNGLVTFFKNAGVPKEQIHFERFSL